MSALRLARIASSGLGLFSSPSTISMASGIFSPSPVIEMRHEVGPACIENEQAMPYIFEAICSAVSDSEPR